MVALAGGGGAVRAGACACGCCAPSNRMERHAYIEAARLNVSVEPRALRSDAIRPSTSVDRRHAQRELERPGLRVGDGEHDRTIAKLPQHVGIVELSSCPDPQRPRR